MYPPSWHATVQLPPLRVFHWIAMKVVVLRVRSHTPSLEVSMAGTDEGGVRPSDPRPDGTA